jgi:membrane fusion protein, adhesin transport system
MQRSDFAFANDIRAAAEMRTPKTARMLLFVTLAFIIVAVIWANFAILDEVKRGNGKVIPSRQTQVVQTLEGGIVGTILVREGDIVNEGQSLMRIDDTKFASEFGEIRERRAAMAARVARLEAEALGQQKLIIPPELAQIAPGAVAAERSVFDTRSRKVAQDIDVLAQDETRLTESLKLLNRELELTKPLFQQKIVPEIEWVRLQQRETEMRGQLMGVQSKILNIRTAFRSQADEDLAKSRGDLAALEENIKSAQDRVRRTEIKAPVYGIINKLNIVTVGAVVQPGANIMDIIPLDDTLLVEGRIRPADIAFIRPNQQAVVKITAYDPSVYGSLKGHVERISADTIFDEKGDRTDQQPRPETFYRVIVRTDKNFLGAAEHPLPIIPGMVTTVEILTGEKSVLDYLLKPARMLRDEALRER